MSAPNDSVLDLFYEQAEAHPNRTAAMYKVDGAYRDQTWSQLAEICETIAASLVASNINPGERIGIISHTRIEWVTVDLGILAAGAVTVPIYPSNLPDEVQFVLSHSGARICFVEDESQAIKCLEVRDALPELKLIVQLSGSAPLGAAGWIVSYEDFLARGAKAANANELKTQLSQRRKRLQSDDVLTIIYTSGTTGRPKGVVLTHGAMVHEASAVVEIDLIRASDTQLLFLPLAHVFAKVLEVCWLRVGHIMAFAEDMTTIKANLGEVRPTVMAGVPRIFEKFHSAVVDKGSAEPGFKQKLFLRALELGQQSGEAARNNHSLSLKERIEFAVLKKLVFAKIGQGIGETLGGRMRVLISGGAPLSPSIGDFFHHANIELLEGYGLTETCGGTTVNRPGKNKIGTVGTAVPGMEVKIASDGEILIKGPAALREYWKDPSATQKSLSDGWFHTGDIGELDPHTGTLKITDRKKDIIVTAGGKNIAPQKLEGLIKSHRLVSQVVVHGDKRKFLSALITVDPEQIQEFARSHSLSGSYQKLCHNAAVEKEVARIVDLVNVSLPSHERIKKFKLLDQDFTIETGELTPKLSVKRKVVNTKFGHYFDAFYAETY